MRAPIWGLVVLLAFAPMPAARAAAQTDARLVAAVRSAQEGQGDSARSVVRRLLAATPVNDTLYPQILYTAAIIAPEAAEMRRQLQRVAVEFPASSWTDDALLRLAQLDYATRNLEGAAQNLERIAIDFPTTPLFPRVAYWAGRTYFDLKKDTAACRWLANGMARSGDDIETQTQLGYLYQRCGAPAAPTAADSTASATPPAAAPVAPAAPTRTAPRFQVQVAAVGSVAAADAAARKVRALGYRAVTVRESALYKVRAGEFPTRTDAQRAATALKAKLGGNPFVVIAR